VVAVVISVAAVAVPVVIVHLYLESHPVVEHQQNL